MAKNKVILDSGLKLKEGDLVVLIMPGRLTEDEYGDWVVRSLDGTVEYWNAVAEANDGQIHLLKQGG